MHFAISQVCTLSSPFAADVADFAAAGCATLEIWLGKLETYLADHSLDDALRLLAEHGLTVPVASYQGGLLDSQGDARREHWAHFARRLDLCGHLGVGTLVIAADVAGPLSQQLIERVKASLREAATQAAAHGVRLALEHQARAALGNNLQTAAALVEEVGLPNLGLCLDAFHFAVGPSKTEDLHCLTSENLFHVQVCDLSGVPRELASDSDRILPGDGDLPLGAILARLRTIGYRGAVSVELMNPTLWQVPPRQFGEVALAALRGQLEHAE